MLLFISNVMRYLFLPILCAMFYYSCESGDNQPDRKILAETNTLNVKRDTVAYFLQGQKLFRTDCNTCHVAKKRLHNYLEGVVQRVGEEYLIKYLTKQDSLINSNDKYALKLKEVYGNAGNSHNFKYDDEQLLSLIEYLR